MRCAFFRNWSFYFLAGILLVPAPASLFGQKMAKAEEPEEVGLTSIGNSYFPNPGKLPLLQIHNPGFESPALNAGTVRVSGFEPALDTAAPEGGRIARAAAGGKTASLTHSVKSAELLAGSRPYLLSLWLKSTEAESGTVTCTTDEVYFGRHTPLQIPSTGGEWKRVGFFFRTAPGTTELRILLRRKAAGPLLEIDDIRLRPASEAEFSKAWTGWRSNYPERDLSPRPDDGKNLANFVSKLKHPVLKDKPLLVMGIGSSYTNMLGNGERLVQWIREKFPDAPPIIYRKHVGSAVNFDFTRGWMRQHVLGQQPDLVILYSGGTATDLGQLLSDFRAHSSADVIVASLHFRERDGEISDATVNAPEWDEIAAVARQFHCEWVDSRREWAAYLKQHQQPIEWLLKDAVHQNDHGALVINENIVRHIVENPNPNVPAAATERLLFPNMPKHPQKPESVISSGDWKSGPGIREFAQSVILQKAGDAVKVKFQGNRLDLIGRYAETGGSAKIFIDGKPADPQTGSFLTTLILPDPENHKPERGLAADRAPHLILLGKNVVPQQWAIQMTSDTGDYKLIGSVTGEDGTGNNGADFTSDSGQITVPTALWRRRLEKDGTHSNRTGDVFRWEVQPAVLETINFRGTSGTVFSIPIVDQLSNDWHTLTVKSDGSGPIEILGFKAHEPLVKYRRQ
ncbi:MAG: SGNH/GDSL hydrolase family protein [Verrucomicrobiales bacterium]|nr:SGNH/GDSL hydrolase family protein [Verrucomicrobiales bacterium]